jgi:capsular exopolysaccharide synthesis family protein
MVHIANQPLGHVQRRALVARDRAFAPEVAQYLPPANQEHGFIEIMGKLWRHRWLVAGCTIVLGGLAVAVAFALPSYFVAESRVQVGVQAPRYLNVDAVIADVSPDQERVHNEALIVQSRDVAKQVVDRLKLLDNPEFNPALQTPSRWSRLVASVGPANWPDWLRPDRAGARRAPAPEQASAEDRVIDSFLRRVEVLTLGRSHVLSIKAASRDAAMAAAIANALADVYLEHQRGEKIKAADQVERFLQGRIAELRDQVRKSDQAVEEYRKRHGLYKGQSSGVTSQQLTELNTQLIQAQSAAAEAESRLREAQSVQRGGMGGESVPEVLRSPLIAALKQQLAEAERKAGEAAAVYGSQHRTMLHAKGEVASLQARVGAEVAKVVDGLAREARMARARYETLNQNFEQLKGQMGTVNDRAIELDALERDATVNRNLLEAMLNRVRQNIGLESILQANAKLVSPASAPAAASYPPKALLAFLGSLGGLLVGSAIALLREGADRTFRRADQIVATTGLPVLAVVPQVSGGTPPHSHVLRKPTSPYSESVRRLHIGLELAQVSASPRTVLFTSAVPAEGKSVLVASLGRLLASNGKRILLVDCDWRDPKLHQVFRCSNKNGLAELLASETPVIDDFIHCDALSGVDVLTAGAWTPQATHVLTSERMRILLDTLTSDYDQIILDTPPVLIGAEVLAFSRMVEKVVFVVRWGHTRRETMQEGVKQILEAHADIAGFVMSRVVPRQYRRYADWATPYQIRRPAMSGLG